jgi:hypothetical protein
MLHPDRASHQFRRRKCSKEKCSQADNTNVPFLRAKLVRVSSMETLYPMFLQLRISRHYRLSKVALLARDHSISYLLFFS